MVQILLDFGSFFVPLLLEGQWWRLITSIFLHFNIWHLFMNSYCLFLLCPPMEKEIGHFKFIALYLFSGILGNLLSMLMIPLIPSAGASGALFGIIGAFIGFNLRYKVFHPSLIQQLFYWLLLNILIGFSGFFNINIWAHLGGLIGGFLFSILVRIK